MAGQIPYHVLFFLPLTLLLASPKFSNGGKISLREVLIGAKEFNVVAGMLAASGVEAELEADEVEPGITLFVPTDTAFGELGEFGAKLQGLPAEQKVMVLRYQALHSYHSLASLEGGYNNPSQPTLASETSKAGGYTLNITGTVINTGIVESTVTRSLFDQPTVAVFAVSKVLLPPEIFGQSR